MRGQQGIDIGPLAVQWDKSWPLLQLTWKRPMTYERVCDYTRPMVKSPALIISRHGIRRAHAYYIDRV